MRFPATRQSVLERVRSDDAGVRRDAFGDLAAGYWKPSYHYLRLQWRLAPEDAEDAVQAFFATAFEKEYVERYDPAQSRFRTFLRVCLDRYVQNLRKAATAGKRGGGAALLSLDFPGAERELGEMAAEPGDADRFFHDETVRFLFARTVASLEAACERDDRAIVFRVFQRHDLAPSPETTYASVAADLLAHRESGDEPPAHGAAPVPRHGPGESARALRDRGGVPARRARALRSRRHAMTRLADGVIAHLKEVATWPPLPAGRYEIRHRLGRGGMGTVYVAYDRRLEREVAIKVSNAAAWTSELETRLRQEARVLARLEHPGIVPVHDAGELEDGRWFYVMKRVRGETLVEHLPRLGGEAAMLGVVERIAETVAFAHAAGIVHRDLKPSNIMLGPFGEVLVLDWGVAKILGADREASGDAQPDAAGAGGTASGTRIGTAGFMAPEQQRGDASSAGPAADVYALGAILAWMLTGRPTPSRRLRAIVAKCQAEVPDARYADAGALVADLARYRAGLAVLAHPESVFERAGRFVDRYRAFILLVAAYLIMRALFAWSQRR